MFLRLGIGGLGTPWHQGRAKWMGNQTGLGQWSEIV